jgi:hypothetical protein
VDVAYIEPVEGDGVGMAGRFRVPDLAVLLRLGGLDNDGNTSEFLTSELEGGGNGFFTLKLDVADTAVC